MSQKMNKRNLAVAFGAALAGSMALAGQSQAFENPFSVKQLDAGYMQLAAKEAACGSDKKAKEGSCGESSKMKEGSCGENKAKEGSCGENKAMQHEVKVKEAKCGEAKCGANK